MLKWGMSGHVWSHPWRLAAKPSCIAAALMQAIAPRMVLRRSAVLAQQRRLHSLKSFLCTGTPERGQASPAPKSQHHASAPASGSVALHVMQLHLTLLLFCSPPASSV